MIIPTKLSKNHASSATAKTTFEGRTEVDVVELLKQPNVQKLIQQMVKNTPVAWNPEEIRGSRVI